MGTKRPNAFGLYDMHGNVCEWCSDWYDENYYKNSPVDDPQGPSAGSSRVLRGGGFNKPPVALRCANRDRDAPAAHGDFYGFRVVCETDGMADSSPSATSPSRKKQVATWISKNATYTVSSTYGTRVTLPSLLTDERPLHNDGHFSFHTEKELGAHITIDLGKEFVISQIYIQNRTGSKINLREATGLTIWLSSSERKKGAKVWAAEGTAQEWEIPLRTPMTARYVTIGLPENVANYLHLRKVKIFGHE